MVIGVSERLGKECCARTKRCFWGEGPATMLLKTTAGEAKQLIGSLSNDDGDA